jgi:hypothetical protein
MTSAMSGITQPMVYALRIGVRAVCALWLVAPCSASASLGGDTLSVRDDHVKLRGDEHVVTAPGHCLHEMLLPTGTRVREYVSPEGVVFGVTWKGPFRPDLRQLLGQYFDRFERAAQAAKRSRRGGGPLVVSTQGLVVHMAGTARASYGRAYVPDLVPPGISVDSIL